MLNIFVYSLLLLIVAIKPHAALASEIKPFTTDGCSIFPDGYLNDNALWLECCIRHDFAYWMGGTEQQREAADHQLQQCVADIGEIALSQLMLFGVRAGGSPFYPTWYRWGYGWPYLRGYQPLNKDELTEIKRKLNAHQKLIESLANEIP